MQAGILFDNGGTVFLSVFISLWAVTFHEHWKRCCAAQAHRWDCSDFEEIEVLIQHTVNWPGPSPSRPCPRSQHPYPNLDHNPAPDFDVDPDPNSHPELDPDPDSYCSQL